MKELIVRKAAGSYWLIKPKQKEGYIAPLMINESAAEIVGYLKEGKTIEEIVTIVSEGDFSIEEEIKSDISKLTLQIESHFNQETDICEMK